MLKASSAAMFVLACVTLILGGCGGSSGSNSCSADHLMQYLPDPNEVSGWDEDTGPTAGTAGKDATCLMNDPAEPDATEWVNGAMDFFEDVGGWKGMAKEYYINADDVKIVVYLHEMESAAKAQEVYTAIVDYSGMNWTDTTLGGGETVARLGSAGAVAPWYIDAVKGKIYVETQTKPTLPENEQLARDFTTAVLNKLP